MISTLVFSILYDKKINIFRTCSKLLKERKVKIPKTLKYSFGLKIKTNNFSNCNYLSKYIVTTFSFCPMSD